MKKACHCVSLLLIILLCSCQKQSQESCAFELMKDFVGVWDARGTAVTEEWSIDAQGNLRAVVTSHAGREPEVQEYIDIIKEGDEVYYIGTVLNQNKGAGIRFRLIECEVNSITFENALHDFPQYISYSLVTADKLNVHVSGTQKGRYREFDIAYYRIP